MPLSAIAIFHSMDLYHFHGILFLRFLIRFLALLRWAATAKVRQGVRATQLSP